MLSRLFAITLLLGPTVAFVVPVKPLQRHKVFKPTVVMQEGEDDSYTKGISPVLGGGKLSTDEPDPQAKILEAGSAVAFAVVFAALVFGAVNPDAVEEIAKSQRKPCDPTKIINGKRVVCKQEASIAAPSPFPAV